MPELPELQAHAERLTEEFDGRVLESFTPFGFTVLKTATPRPDEAVGAVLQRVWRRGKYLLVEFAPVTFTVHLMQGGRLRPDTKHAIKPRGGQARWRFTDGSALLLTEQGTERRVGVWCLPTGKALASPPLASLGPDATEVDAETLNELFLIHPMRLHGFLRDQQQIAGLGRRLANEVCHRAGLSPFASTARLGIEGATRVVNAIHACCDESLAHEREQGEMGGSATRPSRVHHRQGQPCPECGDAIRAIEYSDYTINYCATCQTGGKVLADNTTSKFLK